MRTLVRKKSSSMDMGDRPHSHRSGAAGSELFICFTSRPSASSSSAAVAATMRVPFSKSLLSPCRGRDPSSSSAAAAPSLSASLSRRLRSSGSVKGGQSPMFAAVVAAAGTGGRRKGCAFEAAEPSSPKVTCIGQVRVKTGKRKAKKGAVLRSRSRRAVGGEPSFRSMERKGEGEAGESECLPSKSFCEVVKAFGSELNCFLSCGGRPSFCCSSRTAAEKEKAREGGEKRRQAASWGSFGAALVPWVMAIQGCEEGKLGDVSGLVVEKGGKDDMGLLVQQWEEEEEVEVEKKDGVLAVGDAEDGRVSICIPPPNALLLMRCRSDPVRVAALANRFWGSPAARVQPEVEDERQEEEEEKEEEEEDGQCHPAVVAEDDGEEVGVDEMNKEVVSVTEELDLKDWEAETSPQGLTSSAAAEEMAYLAEEKEPTLEEKEEQPSPCAQKQDEGEEAHGITKDVILDDQAAVEKELRRKEEKEEAQVKGRRSSSCSPSTAKEERKLCQSSSRGCRHSTRDMEMARRYSFSMEIQVKRPSFSSSKEARRASFSGDRDGRSWSFSIEQGDLIATTEISKGSKQGRGCSPEPEQAMQGVSIEGPSSGDATQAAGEEMEATEAENLRKDGTEDGEGKEKERGRDKGRKSGELPDCLLLMMYEPKLSMEVSKETWVCSTNFLHYQNRRRSQPHKGGGSEIAKSTSNVGGDGGDRLGTTVTNVSAPKNPACQQPLAPPPPHLLPVTVATVEQELQTEMPVAAKAPYASMVLKRCKSEPVRSSARPEPDACFWKERHHPIGAAGISF